MDGLLAKICFDFLNVLEKRGLFAKKIRIRFLPRDLGRSVNLYQSFKDLEEITEKWNFLKTNKYLCSSGAFPVIENITLENTNLNFKNFWHWYNITNKRKCIKDWEVDLFRETRYEKEILRYENLMLQYWSLYTDTLNKALAVRLESYVDPCYVDAGYVSPNTDPSDPLTLQILKIINS